MRVGAASLVASLLAAAPAAAPPPSAAVPADPERLAPRLATTTVDLRAAVERWRRGGDTRSGLPPRDVTLLALYQQRIYRALSGRPAAARATIRRLPPSLRSEARDIVAARRALSSLATPTRLPRIRTGRAQPAGRLLAHYRAAQRRFGVAWHVLAAVNFVESAFGRLRNASSAGAQGPMQFMPATWRAYGLGGDVHDPRDAVLGAANYLRASGAPRNYRQALYAYNRSWAYVDAVLRYARLMRSDVRAFYAFYSWQVFVRTPRGVVRVTGPGR